MNRAPFVLTATAAGTAGVLAFHAGAPTVRAARQLTATIPGGRSAAGDAIGTRYGNAQVRVTIKNGKIVAVTALQLQGNDAKSVQISSHAAPYLEQSALAKQSAAVDVVSGATFTSASYAQSLQSALDKLGYTAPAGARATLQVP
ncbi:MAG: hypothetical protein QOF76_3742 [Solirubrobacteraceae bacterium]|nr:hypothetical protein [Solirubrobacteraceae bacterium]